MASIAITSSGSDDTDEEVSIPTELLAFLVQSSTDAPLDTAALGGSHSTPVRMLQSKQCHPALVHVESCAAAHHEHARSRSSETGDSVCADPTALDAEPSSLTRDERAMLLAVLCDSDSDYSVMQGSSSSRAPATQLSTSSSSVCSSGVSECGHVSTDARTDSDASRGSGTSTTPPPTASRPKRVRKPRPNRKRRKHEVDELRVRVQELTALLRQLRVAGDTRAYSSQQLVVTAGASSSASMWERISVFEHEEARAAVAENVRLRTLYLHQLDTLQHLHALYRSDFDFSTIGLASPVQDSLSKRARCDPFDDDFVIFASLGANLDAQYSEIDATLAATGLLDFDGELAPTLRPKRDARGRFFLESMHSRVLPRDMHVMERAIAETNKSPQMHHVHKSHEMRDATDAMAFVKFIDDIELPHATATLTTRLALKRFAAPDRMVGVWDAVIDVSGCVSMRLREQGWNALRPPRASPVTQCSGGGPRSIEQSCVRYFPIDHSIASELDVAAGSVTHALVLSYRRHLERMHKLTEIILRNQS